MVRHKKKQTIARLFMLGALASFIAPVFSQQFEKITPEALASGKQALDLLEKHRQQKLVAGTVVAGLGLSYILFRSFSSTGQQVASGENEQSGATVDINKLLIEINGKISETQGFSFKRIFNGLFLTLAQGAFGLGCSSLFSFVKSSFSSSIKEYFSERSHVLNFQFDILIRYISVYDDLFDLEGMSERKNEYSNYIITSSNVVVNTIAHMLGAICCEAHQNKNSSFLLCSAAEGLGKEINRLVDHLENGTNQQFKQVKLLPIALKYRKKIKAHQQTIEFSLFNDLLSDAPTAGA